MNHKEIISIGDELINAVKGVFPKNAEIESRFDGDRRAYVCTVYSKINNDKTRPNKPSRIIVIIIDRDSILDADYVNRKTIIIEKFSVFIRAKYEQYEPDHNVPSSLSPPIDEWYVDSEVFID